MDTQQASEVRVALMIKDAVVHNAPGNRTAIITANGTVNFTNGFDLKTGMKFTREEWKEIVEFVNKQAKQDE